MVKITSLRRSVLQKLTETSHKFNSMDTHINTQTFPKIRTSKETSTESAIRHSLYKHTSHETIISQTTRRSFVHTNQSWPGSPNDQM